MPVVAANHGWEELFQHPEMREDIDIESETDVGLCGVKNCAAAAHSRIVYYDSGGAYVGTD